MIETGSKWQHKDGGVYEVVTILDININTLVNTLKNYKRTIWYKDQDGEIYVRTEKHFLTSFKPYEPVYEWRWAYQDAHWKRDAVYATLAAIVLGAVLYAAVTSSLSGGW